MGAAYYVEFELYLKNEEQCRKKLGKYLDRDLKDFHFTNESFNELIGIVLCKERSGSDYRQSENHYSNSFDASYGWENLLFEAFSVMSPYLADGSSIYVEPDEHTLMSAVMDGKLIDGRKFTVKNLCIEDIPSVQEMDEESGFYVSQWLEDLDDEEEANNCFGIFYEKELVGYCTLGYADGALDLDVGPDDTLLSDVYIKPEWRHMCLASRLIHAVIDDTDEDCYLTFMYDSLIEFYEGFGFERVEGTDNVMVKRCE